MQAVVFSGTRGKPNEVLSVKSVPKPTPPPGHVLVRVLFVPIHPSTLSGIIPGIYPGPGPNGILSGEGVGIIEEHGKNTTGAPPVGTRVLVLGSVGGNFAEYTVIPVSEIITVPEWLTDHTAAQLVVNPMTAYLLVHSEYGVHPKPGEWLAQNGAGSVLGKNVIQLGKHFGFKTINIIRNKNYVDDLKSLGADEVICSESEDVQKRISEITSGKGIKYAIDPVGGDANSPIFQSMMHGGKISIFGQLAKEDIHFSSRLMIIKLLTLAGFWMTDWLKTASKEEKKMIIGEVISLFKRKILDCPVEVEFGLGDLEKALEAATKSGKKGAVLLKLSEKFEIPEK